MTKIFFSVHYIYLLQKIIETDVNRYAICVSTYTVVLYYNRNFN